MKVFHDLRSARELAGCSLCLGNFDGVHLGHQALLRAAQARGTCAVLTFEPHPGKVLQPALAPKLITSLARKLELLSAYGAAAVVLQPFTLEYARTAPGEFEDGVFDVLGARHVVVGSDFTYGAARAGTPATLSAAAASRGASVEVIAPVTCDGVVVHSSKVREYLLEGRVDAARRLLGHYFDLDGTVVKGKQRGHTIGFPTANVDTRNEVRPAPGVYAVRARVGADAGSGSSWLGGAANIGVKPTFEGTEVTIEVHLMDFDGDLYGKTLRVQFLERLRSEQRFAGIAELSAQIKKDAAAAREVVAGVARGEGAP